MIDRLVSLLPRSWIRFCGRLQFTLPFLRRPTAWAVGLLIRNKGIIQSGIGKGLKFNATGGYAGYLLGTSEPEEQALLGQHLKAEGVFYDIGANIGFYATLAGRLVGPHGRVFAFEPFAISAQTCRGNAQANGFSQVTVVEAAVSERTSMAYLIIGEGSAVHKLSDDGTGVHVEVVSIDEWRKEAAAPAPTVVMIDVEGAEIEVLKGMRETIHSALPILMVEVHWLGLNFSNYIEETLSPLGYRATTYAGKPLPTGNVRYHALLTPGAPDPDLP